MINYWIPDNISAYPATSLKVLKASQLCPEPHIISYEFAPPKVFIILVNGNIIQFLKVKSLQWYLTPFFPHVIFQHILSTLPLKQLWNLTTTSYYFHCYYSDPSHHHHITSLLSSLLWQGDLFTLAFVTLIFSAVTKMILLNLSQIMTLLCSKLASNFESHSKSRSLWWTLGPSMCR